MERTYQPEEGYVSSVDFCAALGYSKTTLYRYLTCGFVPHKCAQLQKGGKLWAWPKYAVAEYLRRSNGGRMKSEELRKISAEIDNEIACGAHASKATEPKREGVAMFSDGDAKQALEALPAQARKIYEFVPVCNEWSHRELMSEMGRKGIRMDFKMALHWLNELKKAQLVREPRPSHFIRAKTREHLALVEPQPQKVTSMHTQPTTEKTTLIDDLGPIAAQLRALADRIDAVALDHSQREEKGTEAEGKLNALRSLLKSIA